MANPLTRLTIRTNIIAAFAIVFLCTIGLGLFAVQRLDAVNASGADVRDNWLPSVRLLGRMGQDAERVRAAEGTLLLAQTDAERQQATATLAQATAPFDASAKRYAPLARRRAAAGRYVPGGMEDARGDEGHTHRASA
ncbi:MAG TPA: MCP four helix bundle domain-containing protein [Acetobacteraceae bacterium]|nr:MCP four helix bundle domain-containing protein [Acetobacteraceae bacterium]